MTKYYTLGLNIYIEKTGDIEIVYIFKDNEIETKHKIPDIYLSLMEYTYKEKYMSLFLPRVIGNMGRPFTNSYHS